jgi:hypothetical protein
MVKKVPGIQLRGATWRPYALRGDEANQMFSRYNASFLRFEH